MHSMILIDHRTRIEGVLEWTGVLVGGVADEGAVGDGIHWHHDENGKQDRMQIHVDRLTNLKHAVMMKIIERINSNHSEAAQLITTYS